MRLSALFIVFMVMLCSDSTAFAKSTIEQKFSSPSACPDVNPYVNPANDAQSEAAASPNGQNYWRAISALVNLGDSLTICAKRIVNNVEDTSSIKGVTLALFMQAAEAYFTALYDLTRMRESTTHLSKSDQQWWLDKFVPVAKHVVGMLSFVKDNSFDQTELERASTMMLTIDSWARTYAANQWTEIFTPSGGPGG